MRPAHDLNPGERGELLRQLLEAHLAELDAHNQTALAEAVARLREEAADRLAGQGRELVALARTAAEAEAARDARLEAKLSEVTTQLVELKRFAADLASPRPLDIPRPVADNDASIVDMRNGDGDGRYAARKP